MFEGLEVHWLDDHNVGNGFEGAIGFSAASFGEGKAAGRVASWYTSFEAKKVISASNSYLSMLSEISLRAVLADNEPTGVMLLGKFKSDLGFPYVWLSGRTARISVRFQKWKDSFGKDQNSLLYDVGLEGTGDAVLARFKPSDAENGVAVALTLAPVVLATGALDVHGKGVPPSPNSRDYFADITKAESIALLYATAGFGWFFKNAVKVREVRVVGVRLQVQPAVINDPSGKGNDTGLLFDYETDFQIILNNNLKSSRNLTARVDGTGFAWSDKLRWVQVPSGVCGAESPYRRT